jgi:cytoskeletal protein RodZ
MPPRAYVVGYLRAYAAAVGLDADEVVLRFEESMEPGGAPAATAGRKKAAPRAAVAIALGVAAAAAGAALWALLRS